METVKFVSAKKYLKVSDAEFDKVFFCLKGRQEIVVECSDELKKELKKLPQESLIAHSFKTVKQYLIDHNISYIEDYVNTTKL